MRGDIKSVMRGLLLIAVCVVTTFGAIAQKEAYHVVESRPNAQSNGWQNYKTVTVDLLPGFKTGKEPKISRYGGWQVKQYESTGFFRTQKIDGRWWIIDPEGYPFIHKGVAVFSRGGSDRQKQNFKNMYGSPEKWASAEMEMLSSYGFNGLGAWSEVDIVRDVENPLVYTIIVSPMGEYRGDHRRSYGGKYKKSGWQGYRFDLAMVFDPKFDYFVEKVISKITKYKDDKYLLGYYTDNELPWVNDALDRHLTLLAKDESGYLAAREWYDKHKGKEACVKDITEADREAFNAFYFETYMKKVSAVLRKYDPNHLYLGCRFNQHKEELNSPAIFRVAGKYMDIVSINHYRKWQPEVADMKKWEEWSNKPFIITEWYTKGEDSELPNNTGAGWNVRTQHDRGLFYQNFAIELLKSGNCVGWHWFTYMDNDPTNPNVDYSNRDSNKGVVEWNYNRYIPLLENMKKLNDNTYRLIQYFDKRK